jgi:hypothetical protein
MKQFLLILFFVFIILNFVTAQVSVVEYKPVNKSCKNDAVELTGVSSVCDTISLGYFRLQHDSLILSGDSTFRINYFLVTLEQESWTWHAYFDVFMNYELRRPELNPFYPDINVHVSKLGVDIYDSMSSLYLVQIFLVRAYGHTGFSEELKMIFDSDVGLLWFSYGCDIMSDIKFPWINKK